MWFSRQDLVRANPDAEYSDIAGLFVALRRYKLPDYDHMKIHRVKMKKPGGINGHTEFVSSFVTYKIEDALFYFKELYGGRYKGKWKNRRDRYLQILQRTKEYLEEQDGIQSQ